jgi:hypothetical protein
MLDFHVLPTLEPLLVSEFTLLAATPAVAEALWQGQVALTPRTRCRIALAKRRALALRDGLTGSISTSSM